MSLLVIFWLLGIADIATTALCIHLNILEEGNPLLLWFFHGGGLATMVLFKVSELTVCLGFVALCIERGWIIYAVAKKYILAGMLIYLLIAVPAYVALFI